MVVLQEPPRVNGILLFKVIGCLKLGSHVMRVLGPSAALGPSLSERADLES